jgi:lysyl-tRNA synthetase, class II
MRRGQLAELRKAGIDPYPNGVSRTHSLRESAALEPGCGSVRLAARVSRIGAGPGPDEVEIDLRDAEHLVSLRIRPSNLDAASRLVLDNLATGDVVEVGADVLDAGLEAKSLRMLSKSLRQPPAHSTANWEAILAGRRSPADVYFRSRFVQAVRNYFHRCGFVEVDTPLMAASTDFDYMLRAFTSQMHLANGETEPVFFNLSPEYFMKRVLASGFEKIFQITKFCRDGDLSYKHNPEFLAVEWYQAYASYRDTMARLEDMCVTVISETAGRLHLDFQGHRVDLTPPWPRLPLGDAIRQYLGVEMSELVGNPERIAGLLKSAGVEDVPENCRWEALFAQLMPALIEPKLGMDKPVFITDYPRLFEFGQMARVGEDRELVERYELYICGLELCNGSSELIDPDEQSRRFDSSAAIMHERLPECDIRGDRDYVRVLEYGLPPSSGVALGLDRLLMLILDAPSIDQVMLFPYSQLPRGVPIEQTNGRRT